MPELPEVEILRQYFAEAVPTAAILGLEFLDERDKIFRSSRADLKEALTGNRFSDTYRCGKYFFARLSGGGWLHLHFGMTGDLELLPETAPLPRYTRFVIHFENGEKLAFRDLRKFGVVELVRDPRDYLQRQGVGPDLMDIGEEAFVAALQNRKTAVKTALLDQKKFAGIGNWIADEMLFRAGVHPETKPAQLPGEKLRELYRHARAIVEKAITHDTHYGDFPEGFLVNYRQAGARHPDYPQSPVEVIRVGGRGTYFVPDRQPRL